MLDETHITRDGDRMLIAEMDTEHLINYLCLMVGKVRSLYEAARNPVLPEQSYHHRRLYGDRNPKVTEDDAATAVIIATKRMYPYMAEALFRIEEIMLNDKLAEKLRDCFILNLTIVLERNRELPRLTGAQVYRLGSGTTVIDLSNDHGWDDDLEEPPF